MAIRIVDLTFPIYEGMMTFPSSWHPKVEITQLGYFKTEGRETRRIVLGSHTGTHIDAPSHFILNGATVDKLSLDILIGHAIVINLTPCKPFYEITIEDLKRSLGNKQTKRLIIRTDWSDKWETPVYYTDHPFLSKDAAKWLVKRGLRLLALDTPSPDNPFCNRESGDDSPNHKFFLSRGVIIVEYLCNLKEIKKNGVELVVLPLKVKNSDGSSVRCITIEKE